MSEVTISLETAEAEFKRFLEFLEIGQEDKEDFNEKELEVFNSSKRKVVKAIQKGKIEIPEVLNGVTSKFTNKGGSTFEFKEVTGSSKVAMDKINVEQSNLRMYTFLGNLSGFSPDTFKLMRGKDLGIVEALAILFLLD